MPKPTKRSQYYTLFDPDYQGQNSVFRQLPYYLALRSAGDRPEQFHLDEVEAAIFSHVSEHEVALYEPRGWISGPLTWKVNGQRAVNLGVAKSPVRVPAFVERDALSFVKCDAEGVLLIEDQFVFDHMVKNKSWSKIKMVLAYGAGIPRIAMRRLLHRCGVELKLPIYLLTDNDTWGYFIFSVLKRGLLGPHATCKFMHIANLRFLGLRAGELMLEAPSTSVRPWKRIWSARLKHMQRYPCFSSGAWQQEFERFTTQRHAIMLREVYQDLGPERFVDEYITDRIRMKIWLR